MSATLSQFAVGVPTVAQLDPLWWITATTTLASGMLYMDGSGRTAISRTVKAAVVERVVGVQRMEKVHTQVGRMKNKMKAVITTSGHESSNISNSSHKFSDKKE